MYKCKFIKNLNNNIFKNEKYNEKLIEGIDKYWGKYTFLSFETIEKNKDYIDNNISKNIIEIIDKIWSMTDGFIKVRKLNNIQKGIVKKISYLK